MSFDSFCGASSAPSPIFEAIHPPSGRGGGIASKIGLGAELACEQIPFRDCLVYTSYQSSQHWVWPNLGMDSAANSTFTPLQAAMLMQPQTISLIELLLNCRQVVEQLCSLLSWLVMHFGCETIPALVKARKSHPRPRKQTSNGRLYPCQSSCRILQYKPASPC